METGEVKEREGRGMEGKRGKENFSTPHIIFFSVCAPAKMYIMMTTSYASSQQYSLSRCTHEQQTYNTTSHLSRHKYLLIKYTDTLRQIQIHVKYNR